MTDFNNCSIDLETLGTRPGDTILSIGAVMFDREGIRDKFYRTISMENSKALGFKAQKSTIEWWGTQDVNIRNEAFSGSLKVEDVLNDFATWLPQETRLWGNGANFDNALLSAAYNLIKKEQPWKFYHDRCYRTIASLFLTEVVDRVGPHHHALHDAESQALRLIHIANKHNIVLK